MTEIHSTLYERTKINLIFYYHCYAGLGKQKFSLLFSKDLISFPIINKV